MTGSGLIQVNMKHEPFVNGLNMLDQSIKLIAMNTLTHKVDGTPVVIFLRRYDATEILSFPRPKGAKLIQFKLADIPLGVLKCVALLSGVVLIPVVCELVDFI